MRKERKREHVENYLKTCYLGDTLFQDIILDHNALPELNFDEIDTSCTVCGKKASFPLMINAITGGADISEGINRDLSILAAKFQIPMAVGSETIALEDREARESFCIVREIMGEKGIILGNLSALSTLEEVEAAAEIIQADGMQLHLNAAQEMSMCEGDRCFRGTLENIAYIKKNYEKPLMIKEVGFGINKATAQRLYDVGIRWIDISGSGGTNFLEIENCRQDSIDFSELYCWGNPTAEVLIQCSELPDDLKLMASGGIKNAMHIVKSLVLGADLVGMSGEILNFLIHGGYEYTEQYFEGMIYKVKMIMLLLGAKSLEELKKVPFRIKGDLLNRLTAKKYR